jgi:YVTN family beta-propeller protein
MRIAHLIFHVLLAHLFCVAGPVLAASGSASYTYDALGRIKVVTYDNSTTITYGYDAADNRTSLAITCGGTGCGGTLAPSATTLVSNPDPSAVAQSVTFTASVTPTSATGSVTFKDGTTTLGSGTLSSGVATFSISTLALGNHSITAVYGGDTNFAVSTSAIVVQAVGATTTTLASNANPATSGTAVTLTATVTGGNATGTVNFTEGGVSLAGCGAVTLAGSGNTSTASCSTSSLAVGTHTIAATYSGDGANGASNGSISQVINQATQVPSITSAHNATFAVGQAGSFTFTATGFPAPTFSLSGCTLPTGVGLNATSGVLSGTPPAGTAATYNCTLTATNSAGSALQNFTLVVTTASSTSLAANPNPATYGATVTLTATVSGSNPTGTVSFADNSVGLAGCGSVALAGTGNSRTAVCTSNTLAVGTHGIVASYSGDSVNGASSSSALSLTINAGGTVPPPTALKTFNPSTITAGSTSVLTITLNPKLLYVPSNGGNALIVINSKDNAGLATIPVGTAPYYAAVNAGASRVYVTNNGDASVSVIDTSSNTVIATIGVGAQPTGVAVSPAGSVAYVTNYGAGTVSVINTATNSVSATLPAGTNPASVAMNAAGTRAYVSNMGSATVSVFDTASNVNLATIPVSAGPSSIVVNAAGSRAYVVNSGANSVSVIDIASNTVVATVPVGASPAGIALNPAGTLAYVANYNGSSVSVLDTTTNTVSTTIVVAANPSGVAVNPLGTKVFVSTPSAMQVIDPSSNSVTATFTAGQNPSLQAASIVTPFAATTTGVAFTDSYPPGLVNASSASPATTCLFPSAVAASNGGASVALSIGKIPANDSCAVTVNVTSASGGTYVNSTGPITTNSVGTGAATTGALTVSGGLASTTTFVKANPSSAPSGTLVTFTATVTGSAPTGTVSFTVDQGNIITGCRNVTLPTGTDNVKTAKCTTNALGVGNHIVRATYNGDAANASSSGTTSETISAAGSPFEDWWRFDGRSRALAAAGSIYWIESAFDNASAVSLSTMLTISAGSVWRRGPEGEPVAGMVLLSRNSGQPLWGFEGR